jgi:hypothetical protein
MTNFKPVDFESKDQEERQINGVKYFDVFGCAELI